LPMAVNATGGSIQLPPFCGPSLIVRLTEAKNNL
jgi:hypothetical protein